MTREYDPAAHLMKQGEAVFPHVRIMLAPSFRIILECFSRMCENEWKNAPVATTRGIFRHPTRVAVDSTYDVK